MAQYTRDPRWTTCRFPSQCAHCKRQIKKGERIFYYPVGKEVYCDADKCGGKRSAEFGGAVADESLLSGG